MSSGKVKCTCGWSWNKSDSSKKDMYICHECGRDNSNNMKNGGWLDNYNDSQASAPEGMEGDGFSNVGRNYSPAWGGQFQNGGKVSTTQKGTTKKPLNIKSKAMTSKDSIAHQADKILKYEQLRGGPGGAPLPYYSDPQYMDMLMGNVYPEVQKIMPNASAMEVGEAMDFVFNAGWDKDNNKITKDPRAFALQEYYRQNDPSKLDKDGKWSGRKNAPYSFDQEYANTIGKLPENQRRLLMNKGRDWYYKNINNPSPGVPSSNYNDTWYGRIWNTNDFLPFDPNNPKFTPKKQMGGSVYPVNYVPQAQNGFNAKEFQKTLDDKFAKDKQSRSKKSSNIKLKDTRDVVVDETSTKPVVNEKLLLKELKQVNDNQQKIEDAKEYYKQYLNSPKARERISNMMDYRSDPEYDKLFPEENNNRVDQEIKNRLDGLNKLQGKFEYVNDFGNDKSSYYKPKTNSLFIRPNSDMNIAMHNDPDYTPSRMELDNTIGHEIGHNIATHSNKDSRNFWFSNGLSKKESDMLMRANIGIINSKNREEILKSQENPEFKYNLDHDNRPSELKADIDALRYQLYRQGVYDPGTQDFTREHLEKAKSSFTRNRLNEHFTDEELIDLMNKLSYNENQNDDITPIAQMGASIPGAVGFSYARVGAPSKGPRRNQTDVTDASAQNGEEMRYYQQGLDFKPKSISKNGGWLDQYDVAQDGDFLDKFRESHPSVRSMINDSMNRKIQKSKGKGKETTVTQKDNTRTITPKEIKKLSGKEQNELAQRQSEEQARKEQVFENMQEAYKSPLMSPGYFTPEGAAIGALQGTTKMGPDLYEGNYKGAAMDALMMLPIAIPAAKTLGRTLGTEEGLLSNAWKLNPKAYQYNLPENTMWRGLGKEGMEDAVSSGLFRSKQNVPAEFFPGSTLRMDKSFGTNPYFTPKFKTASSYGDNFLAEVPRDAANWKNRYARTDWSQIADRPIPINEGRLLQKDWWQGYKQLDLPGRNYFEGPLPIIPRNNMIQSSPIDSELEKELQPYISRIGEPSISREEEVFRNVMGHEYRDAKELENTIHFDSNGNIISNPDINKPNLIKKDLSESNNIKHEYFNNSGNKVATFSGTKDPKGYYVNSINVEPQFRRKGIASDIYKNIAKDLQSKNEGTLLSRSTQHQFTDKDELGRSIAPANKLWENLVNKGEAEKFIEGMSHSYKMKPLEDGGVVKDDNGYWNPDNWGKVVEIGSNDITMEGVDQPLLGISDTGDTKLMKPGKNYKFKGKKVTEYPMAKNGLRQEQKGLVNLDQLTNFTNYNKPQPGGWLNKYN